MTFGVDDELLDDPDALEAADRTGLLRDVAAAPARLREAVFLAGEAPLAELAREGRPRALVVAGAGEAGDAGDALAALAAAAAPVPVVGTREPVLPGWIGAADLVVVADAAELDALARPSDAGADARARLVDEAARRGARVVTVGPDGGLLAQHSARARALHVGVPAWRTGTAFWALLGPMLVVARHAGVLPEPPFDAVVGRLDDVSERCRVSKDAFLNPAKTLAQRLAGRTPYLLAATPASAAAARRFGGQLASLARVAAAYGVVAAADDPALACLGAPGADERLHLVVLRDGPAADDPPGVLDLALERAREAGVPAGELSTEGDHVLERLACLVATADFAAAYLAVLTGVDPGVPAAGAEVRA